MSRARGWRNVIGALCLAMTARPALSAPPVGSAAQESASHQEAVTLFETKVRPLLFDRCFGCHGAQKQQNGLRLDSRAGLLKGGTSGAALVPGDPVASLLLQTLRYDGKIKMPPDGKLKDAEVAALTAWVQAGAIWPEGAGVINPQPIAARPAPAAPHWAFQPIRNVAPPNPKTATPLHSPIDRFLAAKRAEKGLRSAAPADKPTLLRRATFDLIGLPPTPDEIRAFVQDTSPDAFARVVDRLLASPHYGERWGRHWLDVARYADTAGETADYPVPDAYRYRNYVIDAFNQDKPYDQFLREQIAGDILAASGPPERYAEQVVATGYLAISRRFGFDPQNYRHLTIDDTLDTMGRSILGLTLGCARCHDHKFDPISAKDYYALYGIFASSRYSFSGAEETKRQHDLVPLLPPMDVETLAKGFQTELAARDAAIKQMEAERARCEKGLQAQPPVAASLRTKLNVLTGQLVEAKKQRDAFAASPPAVPTAYAVVEGAAKNAPVLKRGDPTTPGEEVPRRFLEVLGGQTLPANYKGSGRLQLAHWLTSPANPLTARVIVNRIWQGHFGRGLVGTPNDFGKRGLPPTHPELLDYLAASFMRSGWSFKKMHRVLMLSQAYQMSCAEDSHNARLDPHNERWWRFERKRLDAESIRDAMLAISGALDTTMGGPHPFPPESSWNYTQHEPFQAVYDTNRRSVYLMVPRLRRHPFLGLFDGADPNSSTAERRVTTVPTQALFFLNDPIVHENAAKLAARLLQERSTDRERIALATRLAFGREPTTNELQTVEAYLNQIRQETNAPNLTAMQQTQTAWASYARILFSSNEFLYVE